MDSYIVPMLFLAVTFVAFGLFHGNQRCVGCSDDCDKASCDKKS